MHTNSEPTTKRPKNKNDRFARSDTEDNPSNEDRKPAAKHATGTPTPDGVLSTCAGLKRKSTSTRTRSVVSASGQGIKLEQTPKTETAPVSAPAPTDPSTEQVEASIPTETRIDSPNLNRTTTGTMRRKVAKRSESWYKKKPPPPQNIPASVEESLPYQAEDLAKKYEELYEYRQGKGPFIFLRQDPESYELSKWVFFQRCEYRRMVGGQDSILIPERVKAVDGIGFVRNKSSPSFWEDRLSELADYRKIHGHCNVPERYSENIQLGAWVQTQRTQYKMLLEGKKSQMTLSRVQELEGLRWRGANVCSGSWEARLSELADYRKIHGHCNVPSRDSENIPLGRWVSTQRRQYKLLLDGKESHMTFSRIKQLESLGFKWRLVSVTAWEERLSELADYRKIHGHCNIPQCYSENSKLGRWVDTQKTQYRLYLEGKKSHMKFSRIQELESLGFEWRV
jgi:hypothetical protein